MEHRYTRDCAKPDYDEKITTWLNKKRGGGIDSMPYPVALYHDGFIYRSITGSGLGGFVDICEFLKKLGLVNLIADDATFRGYDAVFAPVHVKVSLAQKEINLQDIPRNEIPKRPIIRSF